MSALTKTTEEIVTLRGEPLSLSFKPEAIRQHFQSCGKAGKRLAALTDETWQKSAWQPLQVTCWKPRSTIRYVMLARRLQGLIRRGIPTSNFGRSNHHETAPSRWHYLR